MERGKETEGKRGRRKGEKGKEEIGRGGEEKKAESGIRKKGKRLRRG